MPEVNVRETRQHISRILDEVSTGKVFVITRRNKPIAKLSKINDGKIKQTRFPSRSNFRAKIPICRAAGSEMICDMRDERG